MLGGKRVAVVIPAYNEARLVERAIALVPTFVDHVIVVDDASSDGTDRAVGRAARARDVDGVRHDRNRGVGAAIVTGYRRALEAGDDVVAVMAGDAQMDPADLPALLAPIVEDLADYAKGDRLSWPGAHREMPIARFAGNHLLSIATRVSSGYWSVRDSQCGYTAISARCLRRLDLDALYTRYGFPNDILAHLHTVGARLAQVTVRPVYGEEVSGISWLTALVRVPLVLAKSLDRRLCREASGRSLPAGTAVPGGR